MSISDAKARFDRKIARKTANKQDIQVRVAGLEGSVSALESLQRIRYKASRALRIIELRKRLENARKRAKKASKSLQEAQDTHASRQQIAESIRRAKKAIGTNRAASGATFFPGTHLGEPLRTSYTELSPNGIRDVDLGTAPSETVVLAHSSQYQQFRALKARGLPIPWLPYSRSVEKTTSFSGRMTRVPQPGWLESASGPLTSVGFPASILSSSIASFPSQDVVAGDSGTELLSKTLTLISENDFDVLTQLVEFRETREMGKDLLRQAQAWIATHADLSAEIGKFKAGTRLLPFVAASTWLSYQLAMKPLILAYKDLTNFESFPANFQVTASGANRPRIQRSWEQSVVYDDGSWKADVLRQAKLRRRYGFTFDITNPAVFAENQLHLREPLSAIWEGITLSFAVDYAVKVGEFIRACEQKAAVLSSGKLTEAWIITNFDRKVTVSPRGNSLMAWGLDDPVIWSSKTYSRAKSSTLPESSGIRLTLPRTSTDNGRTQWLTVAALLTSLGLRPVDKIVRTTPSLPRFTSRQDFLEHWISSPVGYSSLSPLAQKDLRRNLARREAALMRP